MGFFNPAPVPASAPVPEPAPVPAVAPVALPGLIGVIPRFLSASYTDPFTGRETALDPSSFQGPVRVARENAVLADLSWTGYAMAIREDRGIPEPAHAPLDVDVEDESPKPAL